MSNQGPPGWNDPQQPGGFQPPTPSSYGQPGQPGAGYPPGAPAQASSGRSGCRTAVYILLALGFVALLGIGGCTLFVVNLARGPIDAANAWVAQVDEGNYEGAAQSVCSGLQGDLTAADIESRFGPDITAYSLASVNSTNGVTTVEGTVTVSGVPQNVVFTMVEENDEWVVCGIR